MTRPTTLMIGTTKGLFLLTSDTDRSTWTVNGPLCDLWSINHAASDRATGRIWAGGGDKWHGAGVWRSDDMGQTWTLSKLADGMMDEWARNDPEFAKSLGAKLSEPAEYSGKIDSIWSLCFAHGKLWAGTRPAVLLCSEDDGATWTENTGLKNHPSAKNWQPGAAGLTLHTLVAHPSDPKKFWIGISAAGVFRTEDAGATWHHGNDRGNRGASSTITHPAGGSETHVGLCVHNMVRAPGQEADVLYQQNHHGVFRSSDGGQHWDDITAGQPSTFGFPVAVHPKNPEMIWNFPLNGDSRGRFPPGAAAAVWKSADGGETWSAKREGLPQTGCFFTVLRQSMSVDDADQPGVYFATNSGSVFGSFDEGETWQEIARHLPTILCVEAML